MASDSALPGGNTDAYAIGEPATTPSNSAATQGDAEVGHAAGNFAGSDQLTASSGAFVATRGRGLCRG
jgi:hypothetical protein